MVHPIPNPTLPSIPLYPPMCSTDSSVRFQHSPCLKPTGVISARFVETENFLETSVKIFQSRQISLRLFKAVPPTQATSSLQGVLWQSHIQAYIMEYPPHGPCSFFSISFIMSCISRRRSGGCTSIFLINLLNKKKHNIRVSDLSVFSCKIRLNDHFSLT